MKLSDIIFTLNSLPNPTRDEFHKLKREFCRIHKLQNIPSNSQVIRVYHKMIASGEISENVKINKILTKRSVRSMSGIVPIQVLTKPFRCPGKCIFCPNDPMMPKSYIKTEPGAMRAYLNNFDPIKQVRNRLLSLVLTGHKTDKIEMIVLGGTWDVYPIDYKTEFVKGLYDACNSFTDFVSNIYFADDMEIILGSQAKTYKSSDNILLPKIEFDGDVYEELNIVDEKVRKDLNISNLNREKFRFRVKKTHIITFSSGINTAIQANETSKNRIIGLTVETRPEFVTDLNCQFRRSLGVTRLEIGIQNTFDDILEANKRGHTYTDFQQACHRLRQYGFKFSIHLMPGLYKSDKFKDIESFRRVYSDPFVMPDELKFYPTSVIPNTELFDLYQSGEYKPLTKLDLEEIILTVLGDILPPRTRLKRLIRDIPATEISAGSNITNLSQLLHTQWQKDNNGLHSNLDMDARLWSDTVFVGKQAITVESIHHCEEEGNDVAIFTQPKTRLLRSSQGQEELQGQEEKSHILTFLLDTNLEQGKTYTLAFCNRGDVKSQNVFRSLDTRAREIRNRPSELTNTDQILIIRKYLTSVGLEFFVSIEDRYGYLYGFCRLCLPIDEMTVDFECLGPKVAMIRELHVYGKVEGIVENSRELDQRISENFEECQRIDTDGGKSFANFVEDLGELCEKNLDKTGLKLLHFSQGQGKLQGQDFDGQGSIQNGKTQHTGIGRQLMQTAEIIAKNSKYEKISVISGVGVREYYVKLGYELDGSYMSKKLIF